MANAIANATANAMANAVTDHGTDGGGKAEGNWIHKQVEFKEEMAALWCLLEAFWHLLIALGDFFWTPGRLLAHFGPGVQKVAKKSQIG